mmetsp:Transcript_26233/g.46500  ORF Transcript_26233/g.46500 Transcript_26233/m.46500 type:complete len:426 (-) Transcript_26233:28-1305(-)
MSYSTEIAAASVHCAFVESRHAPLGNTFLQLNSDEPPTLRRSRSFAGYVPYSWRTSAEVEGQVMNPAHEGTSCNGFGLECPSDVDEHVKEIESKAVTPDELWPDTDSESGDFEHDVWQNETSNMTSSHGNTWSCNVSSADPLECPLTNATLAPHEHGEVPFLSSDSAQLQQLPHQRRARSLSLNECLLTQEASPGARSLSLNECMLTLEATPGRSLSLNECMLTQEASPGAAPESASATNQGPMAPMMPTLLAPMMHISALPMKPIFFAAVSPMACYPPSNATLGNWTTDTESEQQEATTDHAAEQEQVTTMMIRNVPKYISQKSVLEELNCSGFKGLYDFCYLPRDFNEKENKGYAFVNFDSPIIAGRFVAIWHNQRRFGMQDPEPRLNVKAAELQGLEANKTKWASGRYQRIRNPELRPFIRK